MAFAHPAKPWRLPRAAGGVRPRVVRFNRVQNTCQGVSASAHAQAAPVEPSPPDLGVDEGTVRHARKKSTAEHSAVDGKRLGKDGKSGQHRRSSENPTKTNNVAKARGRRARSARTWD